MALPYIVTEAVWTAKEASETKELKSEFSKCITKVIEVITTEFSGTLDIQGKQSLGATYDNIPYQLMGQAAPQAASVAQIDVTADSARYRYLVPEYWSFLQLVITRTAGTITVNVLGTDTAFTKDLIVKLAANDGVDIGNVDVASVADGGDVAQGALADALVAAGAAGSISAKLRRLTTDLNTLLTRVPANVTTKVFTADGTIGGACKVYWITGASPNSTLEIELNDSADDGGTDKWATQLPDTTGALHAVFNPPIDFATDCYVDLTGLTKVVTVGYVLS